MRTARGQLLPQCWARSNARRWVFLVVAEHRRSFRRIQVEAEGFGIPPLEAMSHGCPVVCSNAGSIPEIVGDAGIYFDPNNAEDLRTALERVATTGGLQADLRARGYARTAAFS